MKKMPFIRIAIIIFCTLVLLAAGWTIGSGFIERTDVYLGDYHVSDDGQAMTISVGVAGSMGYIRSFSDDGGGVRPHYLTFYSAFGGLNSSLGAKNEFTLELGRDDCEIYFNRPDGGYELVLQKNAETGEWERPQQN